MMVEEGRLIVWFVMIALFGLFLILSVLG